LVCTHRLPGGANRLKIRIWLLLVLALALFPVPVSAGKGLTIDLGAHMAGSLAGIVAGLWLIATWPADLMARPKALGWAAPACLAILGGAAVWSSVHYANAAALAAVLHRGDAAILDKDYGRADQEYSDAIRRDPENPVSYFRRGLAFQEAGRVDDAIADYKAALTLAPQTSLFLVALGQLYSASGDQAKAAGYIAKAIELKPDNAMGYIVRGIVKHRSGRSEEAIADFGEAVKLDPSEANGYNSRAFTYLAMGKPREALADIRKALKLAPGDPAILDTEGHILIALGRPDEALQSFNRVLKAKQYAASFYGRGLAYEKLELKAEAIQDYKSALALKVWDIEEKEAQQKARARLEALTSAGQ
jgi:tetratricopeptide (TPR) repeat protein